MSAERQVPFFNYSGLYLQHKKDFDRIFQDVMGRGAFIMQKDVFEFEEKVAKFLNVKHVLSVADGTNAIILGLRAVGIGPGDEVIIPSHTFIASAAAVQLLGGTPVLAELGPDHMLDAEHAKTLITSKTKAIMPVNINGRTCAMDPLKAIAKEHDLLIVEDAAQSLGSKYKGQSAGTFGSFGTFSFYPAKLLGCFGDGGAVVTNDDHVAETVYMLRDHGRDYEGEIRLWGTNSRLDNMQAAFLSFKIDTYPQEIEQRRQMAQMYNDAFAEIADITLPPAPDNGDHFDVYQNYEIQAGEREALRNHLKENGVGTLIQWSGTAVHQFDKLGFDCNLPKTDAFFEKCFMIPMNTTMDEAQTLYVANTVRAFYGLGKIS